MFADISLVQIQNVWVLCHSDVLTHVLHRSFCVHTLHTRCVSSNICVVEGHCRTNLLSPLFQRRIYCQNIQNQTRFIFSVILCNLDAIFGSLMTIGFGEFAWLSVIFDGSSSSRTIEVCATNLCFHWVNGRRCRTSSGGPWEYFGLSRTLLFTFFTPKWVTSQFGPLVFDFGLRYKPKIWCWNQFNYFQEIYYYCLMNFWFWGNIWTNLTCISCVKFTIHQ